MTRKANKTEMKRIVKMLKEYFGETRFADALVDGNTITWEGDYEWNERFNEWFHRNKCYFNCAGIWFENNNGYSISVYR
jgi:hypothetical protein